MYPYPRPLRVLKPLTIPKHRLHWHGICRDRICWHGRCWHKICMLAWDMWIWDMWAQDFGHKMHMLAWDLLAQDMLAQECGTRLVWTGGPIFWLYSSLEARQGRQRGSRGRSPRQAVNPCCRPGRAKRDPGP